MAAEAGARAAFDDPEVVRRLADLVVTVGMNLQPGQLVAIATEPGKEALARAIADSAYRHGAVFVDAASFDPHIKRARLLHAPEETLSFVPPWHGERVLELGRRRAARVLLSGPAHPDALAGVDPERAGLDRMPVLAETFQVMAEETTNWTAVPCPTRAWAQHVHPDLAPDEGWRRLCDDIVVACRLDAPDPAAAWRERADVLQAVADELTGRRFDALRFVGEGTDLTIGLLATSRFVAARMRTVDGIEHLANIPTEEVFTAPDPLRADGVVTCTKPLVLGGSTITGLRLELRDGRVVRVDADDDVEVVRASLSHDAGAERLGEVALVDGQGRIDALGCVFYDTLLDENAASHLAFGQAFSSCADASEHDRLNTSSVHVDLMIGSPEMTVYGVSSDGVQRPILAGGRWQL